MSCKWLVIECALSFVSICEPALARTPVDAARCLTLETVDPAFCTKEEIYAAEAKYTEAHTRWFYTQPPAPMAMVYSLNTFIFGPLAEGRYQHSTLTVMQGSGYKFVSVSAGGLLNPAKLKCTAADCPLSARFDHGPLKTYSTRWNGGTMSLVDPDDFLDDVRQSKKVNIVLPLEENGNVIFEFDISNFKW